MLLWHAALLPSFWKDFCVLDMNFVHLNFFLLRMLFALFIPDRGKFIRVVDGLLITVVING
jgi:hypothetical protein